jgi:hypothetical protein
VPSATLTSRQRRKDELKPKEVRVRPIDFMGLACCAILSFRAVAVYSGTHAAPMLPYDTQSIADNLSIRRLWPIWSVLSPPNDAKIGGRPLLNLTFVRQDCQRGQQEASSGSDGIQSGNKSYIVAATVTEHLYSDY